MSLVNTINLSFDMTKVLTEMEVRGIKINVDTLHQLRDEYQTEMIVLNKKLDTMVKEAMGDTPINLDSGEDRSMVMYSCKVRDKNVWKNSFNLGMETRRGGAKRPKRRPNLTKRDFNRMVADMTNVIYKTKVRQCENCYGKGTIKKFTVKGVPYKIEPKCPKCDGEIPLVINIEDIKIKKTKSHSTKIELTDNLGVVLKYPSLSLQVKIDNHKFESDIEKIFKTVLCCIDFIYDAKETYSTKDHTEKELTDFLESLTDVQFQKLSQFFETMPSLKHSDTLVCKNKVKGEGKKKDKDCGYTENIVLEGLQSFFD